MNYLVIALWLAGCVAVWFNPHIGFFLWAFPAGCAVGNAIHDIRHPLRWDR